MTPLVILPCIKKYLSLLCNIHSNTKPNMIYEEPTWFPMNVCIWFWNSFFGLPFLFVREDEVILAIYDSVYLSNNTWVICIISGLNEVALIISIDRVDSIKTKNNFWTLEKGVQLFLKIQYVRWFENNGKGFDALKDCNIFCIIFTAVSHQK